MLATPEFWVAISFAGFIALLVYYKVPGLVTKQLDERSVRIKAELDEAQRLREEAQTLLAEYQRKRRDAEKEAANIISLAKDEAARFSEETRTSLKEFLDRRMKAAESKISQAETQAVEEVRAATAEAAIAAAESVIAQKMTPEMRADLLASSIADVKNKLN